MIPKKGLSDYGWKTVGAVFALFVQRRWYVRKYSAGLRSGWLMR